MAFQRPGLPSNGMPRARALGFPDGVDRCGSAPPPPRLPPEPAAAPAPLRRTGRGRAHSATRTGSAFLVDRRVAQRPGPALLRQDHGRPVDEADAHRDEGDLEEQPGLLREDIAEGSQRQQRRERPERHLVGTAARRAGRPGHQGRDSDEGVVRHEACPGQIDESVQRHAQAEDRSEDADEDRGDPGGTEPRMQVRQPSAHWPRVGAVTS